MKFRVYLIDRYGMGATFVMHAESGQSLSRLHVLRGGIPKWDRPESEEAFRTFEMVCEAGAHHLAIELGLDGLTERERIYVEVA